MTHQSAVSVARAFFAGQPVFSNDSGNRNLRSRLRAWRLGLARARGIALSVTAPILVGAFSLPAQAQILMGNWTQKSPSNSPSARSAAAMTYDAASGLVVLFGGSGSSGLLNDTWLWDGTNWTNANPSTNPPAREYHAMAFDAASGQVVMFGGEGSSGLLNDTWVWNGTNWTEKAPGTWPTARIYPDMASDPTGNVLLFGGDDSSGLLNDTWEWNGNASTWTQLTPADSPTARENRADMTFDAQQRQVVLFGGDGNGGDLDDTWEWNGTNWTEEIPATIPPARIRQAVAYDAASGEVVLFGGEGSGGYLNDTWVWNGTNWTEETPATSPLAREYHSMASDPAGRMILFGGDNGGYLNDTWEWVFPGNFGNINVCPSGATAPSPCSNTLAFNYYVAATTTFGTTQVVTQGTTGLDFSLASGSTCTGTVSSGDSCTVNVTFTPLAPGLRRGAVELFNSSGALLTTTPIYGVGQGPAVAFGPGTQTTANTGSYSLYQPKGVAVDAAGDAFISDTGNTRVVKVAANGTVTTVGSGLEYPQGLAVDGAGDLFIADNNLNEVVEVTPAGVQTEMNFGLTAQLGVAVDGAGDLFVSDFNANEVVEAPAGCTSSACTTVVYSSAATGLHPVGLAVDAAGDLFVTALSYPPGASPGEVVEIPSGCTISACQSTVGFGWDAPEAVAVDAAGDVFVADEAPYVVEVPAGCTSAACQITVSGILAYGVAVDGKGDIFIPDLDTSPDPDSYEVVVVNRSQPPSLSFDTTETGSTSADSPQTFTVLNVGNQALSSLGPAGVVVTGPNFLAYTLIGPTPYCTAGANFVVEPGLGCDVGIDFEPQTGGPLISTAAITDNALNGNPATQTIALSGTGVLTNYTLAVSTGGSGSGTVGGTNCSSETFPYGTTVTCTATPATGSQFTGWSGGTCSGTGSCSFSLSANSTVVANFSLAYALSVTVVGTGVGTVTSNPAGISCSKSSGTCGVSYPSRTSVILTANATGTSIFVGWGGACSSSGASTSCTLTMNSALNVSASFVAPGPSQAGTLKPITAGVVYGQGGSFTSGTANNGGVGPNSLGALGGVVVDASGNLYAADDQDDRVLFFPAGSTTATRVYGQGGSFTSFGPDNGGVSANSLSTPQGLALDSSGNLYVADEGNNRVLFYPAGTTTATRVYGQGGSFTTNTWNNGGVSATSLGEPYGLALDSAGNLYVGDYQNNRVLFYPAGSTTATRVYGQNGSFTSNTVNNGGLSANSLNQPTGVALDSSGDLYVADIYNNRVLFYPYNSTTATQVYGQGGSFTSNAPNNAGVVSASTLNNPMYVALDSSGDLYVVDRSDNRMLFYPFGSTTATRVYGQLGSFTSTIANNGGITANSFSQPWAVALDSSGNLYVTDYSNNRVLEYGSFGNLNVCPSGVNTPAPCNTTVTLSYNAAATTTFGAIQVVTQGITGLDFSLGSGSTCAGTITAGNSCTVNATFAPLAPGLRMGEVNLFDNIGNLLATAPIYGVGQGPAISFGPGTQTTLASGLAGASGAAVDAAGDVFISNNAGALKITPSGVQTPVPTSGVSAYDVAVDGAGNVFLADTGNNRVVEVTPGGVQTTVPTTGLSYPTGVAVDGAGDVFITDLNNDRVVKVTPSGVQTTVPTSAGIHPYYPAVDAAGDVFFLDVSQERVLKVTPGGIQSTVPLSGLAAGNGVAVDAAGDVFITDQIRNLVFEVTPSGVQTTVPTSGLNVPAGLAVDPAGDVFIADNALNTAVEVNRSQLPSLSFALTNEGSTSADSPQLVSVQNVGNQPLTGSLNLSALGTNFTQNSTPDCSSEFPLAPGASCSESFSFTPQATGYLTGTASFSDNTLNLSPLVALQTINLSGIGSVNGQTGTTIPNVVGMTEAAAATALTDAGLTVGAVSSGYSSSEPSGSVMGESPAAGAQANLGSAVALMISTGEAPLPEPNPLTFENNYLVTGDYATAGVTLVGTGVSGIATGTITIPDLTTCGCGQGVPDGADIVDGFLYWTTVENTPTPSANNGTFLGYSISGQQVGSDVPYTDPVTQLQGTLRVYRADVNSYFQAAANGSGVRAGSGSFTVTLPDSGKTGTLPLTAGASLVEIYRVLSPNFPLKSVVIYDGSTIPTASTNQNMQGFYDAVGGASGTGESTPIYYSGTGTWNGNPTSVTLGASNQYTAPLNAGNAYAAEILSTPVNNSDNDGILDAWKAGPASGFFTGQPGYYDVKTQSWVPLPGAKHGEKDLFVQLDWMCGNVLASGACDPSQENLYPSPDPEGNDPLAMVQQAFAQTGIVIHLEIGNAVPESTCTDSAGPLCQFPGEPGVIGWKNSLEFSKVWPRNFTSCAAGGDCTARFPYGQKDSYHYVLFGHSLAIPAWNTRYGTLTAISASASAGQTTISTTNRGAEGSINYCPSRFTISGVLSNPSLNGVYNTLSCPDAYTIILSTPGVSNWSYNYSTNTPPEPEIGLTSGTVTSISGYSDLGGADSAVTLALWETAPNQDMSKRAQVIAGTLFHEVGHTLGLPHGGLYYDGSPSYIPTFEANCKPNYQSVMNYLFQLDGVGPNAAVAYSNQVLDGEPQSGPPAILSQASFGLAYQLTDPSGNAATFPTSFWYTPNAPSSTTSPATLHCDGTPLTGDTGYRVSGPIAPITPSWSNGQNITFDGVPYTTLRGYNDVANIDLRQVGATGGEFASLAGFLSFGNSSAPLNVAAGGSVAVGAGGTVTLGAGGNMTLGGGGNVTVGSGAIISNSSTITFGTGGNATLSNGGIVTPGSNGLVTLPSGGNVTLSGTGTITLRAGGTIALGAGGNVTLGAGGTITLNSGGTVTIPPSGGTYTIPAGGGTIALGAGGNVTLGAGGNVTLGAGGNIALGAGGNVTLGAGGNVTLSAGGTIALGAGGNVTLGAGGNITLGAGGNIALGAGGTVTLGAGGNVTLGAGGVVALGAGGNVTLGAGGNVTLGAGGTVALGAGGNITLGAGGTVTLGAGGLVTLGAGGTVTSSAGTVTLGAGGSTTLPAGGGTIALGAGGNVTLGAGGVVALGAGGNVTLGAGGNIALGAGGNVTLGAGGVTSTEMDYNTANSIVRPPPSATYSVTSTGGVQVNWTAPAFGVVQTYTISRSVITPPSTTPGPPVVIGSVSGVNGFAPATTFTDTNPPTSGTLVYTIATTLVPDTTNSTPRQSAPSPPAVLTVGETIILGSLPSSVLISSSQLTVTATAVSNISPNPPTGLQVSFSAAGSCSIVSGSQSIDSSGVSSAIVALKSTGSCTVSASQPGNSATAAADTTAYSAATPVSGAFTILPQGSTTQSQTISFGPLPNVQYGSGFSVSASSSASLPVSFSASGPCTVNTTTGAASGTTTGAGLCKITASAPTGPAPNNSTYSAASVTQSFTISTAPLTVTANPITITYGQSIPQLTYTFGPLVNGDSLATAVSGTPLLSTTAASSSNAGTYPITVSTGSLAAANYSFFYVNGTLTISKTNAAINVTPYSVTYNGNPHTAIGTATGVGEVILSGLNLNAATTHTPAGTYTDTWTFTDTTGDYNNTSGTITDRILPASLSITASSPSMIYGGPVPPITPIYMGFVSNESASNLTTQPICTTSASSLSRVGAYMSTCSNASDSNYSINYAPGTVGINQASTTISVTSSSPGNTSTYMQAVTFTATFTPQYSGTTPTGTVTFYNDGSQIGTGTLSLGQATFSTSSLPDSGPDDITAIYAGDSNFTGSQTSSPLVQTVNPAPNVSLSPLSVSFGNQNVNTTSSPITITLTNNGDAPLNIGSNGISINPSTDTQFVETNTCGTSVAATKSCTIAITFKPADTGVQTASLQITDNNDDSAGAQQVISITGAGLSTITGASLYNDAVFATANGCGGITGSGGTSVDSFNSTLGYSSSHVLSGGNVGTNGNVSLSGGSIIYGSAAVDSLTTGNCSSSAVTGDTISGGAKVTGGLVALNGPITYPVLPTLNPAPPTTNQKISGACPSGMSGCTNGPGNETVTLAPGTYGNVQLSGATIADLSNGTYNFNSLVLSGGSRLSVVGSGPVVVNLAGASLSGGSPALDFTGGTMQNTSGIPRNLQFTYAGSQGVNLSSGANSYATVYAPNALVNISGGADFFGSIVGSKFTTSGGGVVHYDSSLPSIQAGNYIWFNAIVNNLKNLGSGQVKLYLTNSTISFTANNITYNVAEPNAVVTFNSASQTSGAKTTYDLTNNRWSTAVSPSGLTGNTFVTGLAFPVPVNFPTGIQNMSWSAAFTTDAPGVTLNWQWGAAVYTSFSTTYATTGNSNLLGVNPEDGAADPNGNDPAGTPETYKTSVIFGATGGGGTNYTGYFSPGAGVVPTIAPMSVSPSSLAFSPQAQGTSSTAMTAVLTNNDAVSHTISSITAAGTNAADFAPTNNCPVSPNTLAAGASCTISVTFTPGDVGSRTAKVVVNDDANNSPQTLYLSGTGH